MAQRRQLIRKNVALELLICFYLVACCISLVCISKIYPEYHILYNPAGLLSVVAIIVAFASISIFFVFAEFSFGYFVGFYFYTMIAGYLWLNYFSEFNYDHRLTGLSAAASAVAFLLPALFIRAPLKQIWVPSPEAFDRILNVILVLAVAMVAAGAAYNFKFVTLDDDMYAFRETLKYPRILSYLTGIMQSAVLPFAFACLVERKSFWRAGAVLILLLLFFPITLTKLAVFSSAWIVFMALLSEVFEAKIAVVLSLFAPLVVGIILFALFKSGAIPNEAAIPYFTLINLRMIAVPSMAMDYYNEFFSKHDVTHFCQIQLLKPFVFCPYQEPIAIVIYKAFGIGGNFNASLFATEGIASVGATFAPITALGSGLVIALGNRLSSTLPPRFILTSGAILPLVLLNVPLTVTLLTHGATILFLLWYITPRAIFEPQAEQPDCSNVLTDSENRSIWQIGNRADT
jgi:hypothetical protein